MVVFYISFFVFGFQFHTSIMMRLKKVSCLQMNISLLAGVYNTLMHFSKETVITLIRSNKFTPPLDASNNTVWMICLVFAEIIDFLTHFD